MAAFLLAYFPALVFHVLLSLAFANVPFAAFSFFLASWLQAVVNAYLFEIVVGQQKGEVTFAVAANAKYVLVLFL
jgi:hypothetical protein